MQTSNTKIMQKSFSDCKCDIKVVYNLGVVAHFVSKKSDKKNC